MSVANLPAGPRVRPAAPVKPWWMRVVDGVGSVTFGISTMVALLVYSWIGSAGLQPFYDWFPRQSVELTEMEWFNWWPFHAICALLALSLVLVTLRRIPFNPPNLGVWTVHVGILVLMLGCVIYFGLKREGDMAVYRRQAIVQLPGGSPTALILQPDSEAIVSGGGRTYRVSVGDLNSGYELLTGADKGKKTLSAQLEFQPLSGGGQPFIRQLLVGYPEYTEDVVPGQGRAIKLLGRKLIDESVAVTLDYAPNDRIFLYDRAALMLRTPGSVDWTEYALRGLPRYREHVGSADAAFVNPGESPLAVRPLALAPRLKGAAGPGLEPVSLRVTGFLPYAMLNEAWEPGGSTFNPYVRFTVKVGNSAMSEVLLANDPDRNRVSLGDNLFDARFVWVDDPAVLERLRNPGAPRLTVRAGGTVREFPLGEVVGREIALAGTPYTLQGLQFFPEWVPPGTPTGVRGTMVLVRVKGPKGTFLRAVAAPDARLTRDLDGEGRPLAAFVDEGIELEAGGIVESGLKLVGSPDGLFALLVSDGGQVLERKLTPGRPVEFLDGAMQLTAWEVSPQARLVSKPRVVPRHERDSKAETQYSLIQVELTEAGRSPETQWLEYSHYAHPSRVGYYPRRITLASGRQVELLYSRETLKLPAPVALEAFQLEVYPGGEKERDYKSLVRFHEDGRWSEPQEVHSNNPTEHDGWWYFQSTWDPPDERAGYAGMNYTGLGVGNRHGVGTMLLGSILTVLGTLWAFYVKPVLLRRRLGERRAHPARGDRSMTRRSLTAALAVFALGAVAAPVRAADAPIRLSVGSAFASAIDLDAIRVSAVQEDGRVKTFDSLARERLKLVNSSRAMREIDPVLLYLDMVLVPEHYVGTNVIFVKKPMIRTQITQGVRSLVLPENRQGAISEAELQRIEQTGLVSPIFLDQPAVRQVLAAMERDLMRTSREVNAIQAARSLSDAGVLLSLWRPVPPVGGSETDPWLTVSQAARGMSGAPGRPLPAAAGMGGQGAAIGAAWQALEQAWRFQDAAAAGQALNTLAHSFALVEPKLYPAAARLSWEHWYYKHDKMTMVWLIYFLALPFLLMATVYRFRWARITGLTLFITGFGLQTFSIVLRWWLAGRIPNSNMFEAVTASAWFGGLAALVLEVVLRRWPVKNLPALAASTYAMFALMLGNFMPVTLNSDISTVMPVLDRTIWLYIHTNMVIASYALIFFGGVTASLYLAGRALHAWVPSPRLAEAWAGSGGTGAIRGGAGSVILGRGLAPGDENRSGLAKSLDGATMIFLELAFITLWVGTILGAVWAYFSWGRPWGWDPKEVFALNTWLVFLVLLHVRYKVKDKALWTAILAVIGCAVMIFNWVAVNFVIVGLHSYA